MRPRPTRVRVRQSEESEGPGQGPAGRASHPQGRSLDREGIIPTHLRLSENLPEPVFGLTVKHRDDPSPLFRDRLPIRSRTDPHLLGPLDREERSTPGTPDGRIPSNRTDESRF